MRYLAGASLVGAVVAKAFIPGLGPELNLVAALGLFCFLAWFLSGMFRRQIELQEAVRLVIKRHDQWTREGLGRGPYRRAVEAYLDALAASDHLAPHPGVLEMLAQSGPLNKPNERVSEGVDRLRRWLRWRFLYRIL